MTGMDTTPYWFDSAKFPEFPPLDRDLRVDVVVVGGGITGITAAYLLKKAGRQVALLERHRSASRDTGHTTAHLTQVTDLRLHELAASFGDDVARQVWEAQGAAIDQIEGNIRAEGIACGFTRVPGYLHAALDGKPGEGDGEKDSFREDAALAAGFGLDAVYLESTPFMGLPGVRFERQAKFHPRKYLAGLIQKIPGGGSFVFEGTEVEEVKDKPLTIRAGGHVLQCDYLIIATHVPLAGKTNLLSAALFQSKLALYMSYAIGARAPHGLLPEALFWDTADPYHYLRVDRQDDHDYLIFGGEDHKTGQAADTTECFRRLERTLLELVPQAQVDHRWCGQVVETPDGLPFIGESSRRQFISTGYAGNGMTFGTLGAMLACEAGLGRESPWGEIFEVGRKKLRAAWDYLRENKDYPYHFIRDRLAKPEAVSLWELGRGQGKILKIEGEQVAAYKDEKGRLTLRSAVCTHLGCIVDWNEADATWDCPCHGSRFSPAGEVLAGPAETPLHELKKKAGV